MGMKVKEVLKFEKENMPDFQWKYEKFLFAFLLIWLGGAILTLIASMIIGFVSGESGGLWYIPLIIWGSALFVTLVIFVIKTKKVRRKLIAFQTEKLSREFYITDYSKAKQKLLDKQKISADGLIIEADDIFESSIIPFEQVRMLFNPRFWGGKLFLDFIMQDASGRFVIEELNNDFYNFLTHHSSFIVNLNLFQLFCEDKEKFVKLLLKYNNASKIEKKLS